jgi:hypothetical protein
VIRRVVVGMYMPCWALQACTKEHWYVVQRAGLLARRMGESFSLLPPPAEVVAC